jgi:hypothetical protein
MVIIKSIVYLWSSFKLEQAMISATFYSLLKINFLLPQPIIRIYFFRRLPFFNDNQNDTILYWKLCRNRKDNSYFDYFNNLLEINKNMFSSSNVEQLKWLPTIPQTAFTIHKKIYFPRMLVGCLLQQNKHKNTILLLTKHRWFLMSSDSKMYANGSLLDDLISYVYSGTNCKWWFTGWYCSVASVNLDISQH